MKGKIFLKYRWAHVLLDFEEAIESGKTELKPIKHLIKHIIKKGYNQALLPATSHFGLCVKLSEDKFLNVRVSESTQIIIFHANQYSWSETCQYSEICDTFDYFLEHVSGWNIVTPQDI